MDPDFSRKFQGWNEFGKMKFFEHPVSKYNFRKKCSDEKRDNCHTAHTDVQTKLYIQVKLLDGPRIQKLNATFLVQGIDIITYTNFQKILVARNYSLLLVGYEWLGATCGC